jgi:hypothetical protein
MLINSKLLPESSSFFLGGNSHLFLHDILESLAAYGMVGNELAIVEQARGGEGPRCVLGFLVAFILNDLWFYSVFSPLLFQQYR